MRKSVQWQDRKDLLYQPRCEADHRLIRLVTVATHGFDPFGNGRYRLVRLVTGGVPVAATDWSVW